MPTMGSYPFPTMNWKRADQTCVNRLPSSSSSSSSHLSRLFVFQGKVLGMMFFEASTRTSGSFQAAMQKLGGTVVSIKPSDASLKKGESLRGRCHTFQLKPPLDH